MLRDHIDRKIPWLKRSGITLFLDVGANSGFTGRTLREGGYGERIVSFEPIADCYAQLEAAARDDPLWQARHTALGERDGTAEIGVAGNLYASSLLEMTPR